MTIEERAIEYAKSKKVNNPYSDSMSKIEKENWTMELDSHIEDYKDIATEQRDIDIQKAVDATCDLCMASRMCRREVRQKECQTILYIKDLMKGE